MPPTQAHPSWSSRSRARPSWMSRGPGRVPDAARRAYLQAVIGQVLRARREGIRVTGYFPWSFTDNFEWAEGYRPRFGLVHVDYETQARTVKDSGPLVRRVSGRRAGGGGTGVGLAAAASASAAVPGSSQTRQSSGWVAGR
ncbi:MAG: family 1 glycosylhydrolase [Hymenobacter sp.]